MNTNDPDDPLWNTAWAWVTREHEGEMNDISRTELTLWLNASPAHRRAYDDASQLWLLAGLVPPQPTDDDPSDGHEP